MCQFERISYRCTHIVMRRYKYCHFSRNDPFHACFGVKVLDREWRIDWEDCEECVGRREGGGGGGGAGAM